MYIVDFTGARIGSHAGHKKEGAGQEAPTGQRFHLGGGGVKIHNYVIKAIYLIRKFLLDNLIRKLEVDEGRELRPQGFCK